MIGWLKRNKKMVSVLLTIGLTSAGVPVFVAGPAADGIIDAVEQVEAVD